MKFSIATCAESWVVATFVNHINFYCNSHCFIWHTFWHFARVVWNFRLSLALTCRSIPLQERSRAVAVVFGGLSFGSVLGYVVLRYMVIFLEINKIFLNWKNIHGAQYFHDPLCNNLHTSMYVLMHVKCWIQLNWIFSICVRL